MKGRSRQKRGQKREDARDPEASEQRAAPAEPIGDDAVDGRTEQKSDQPTRNQEAGLASLQSPGPGHIMNDIGRIERIVSIEQGQSPMMAPSRQWNALTRASASSS